MKKIVIAILVTFGLSTIVSAEIGLKAGVSAQVGDMSTSGKEVSSAGTTVTSQTEKALFATAGFFIEKDLAFLPGPFGRLSIGYDNIVHDLDLGTQRNPRQANLQAAGALATATDHTLEAKVSGFETLYAQLMLILNLLEQKLQVIQQIIHWMDQLWVLELKNLLITECSLD